MTPRDRFRAIMSYRPVDQLPVLALEPYEERAIERWRGEGLPEAVRPEDFLCMSRLVHLPISFGPMPGFDPTVIADEGEYEVVIPWMGGLLRRRKDNPSMFYGHIEHPVKTRADWEQYKLRFQPTGRVPADWCEVVAPRLNASQDPVGLCLFPYFFRLGFYSMGMERFLTAFHDEPDLIHDMFAHWSWFCTETIRPVLGTVQLDYAVFGEDLAGKNGPLISPKTYDEFWAPYQVPLIDLLRSQGVPVVCQWTAGQYEDLMPSLLDQGFNCTWPLERVAGMDPIALRERWGRRLLLGGGISKEAVIAGPAAIDAEIERLRPLIEEGGFIPAMDDMASPDMAFAHYRHMVEALQGIRL